MSRYSDKRRSEEESEVDGSPTGKKDNSSTKQKAWKKKLSSALKLKKLSTSKSRVGVAEEDLSVTSA